MNDPAYEVLKSIRLDGHTYQPGDVLRLNRRQSVFLLLNEQIKPAKEPQKVNAKGAEK